MADWKIETCNVHETDAREAGGENVRPINHLRGELSD